MTFFQNEDKLGSYDFFEDEESFIKNYADRVNQITSVYQDKKYEVATPNIFVRFQRYWNVESGINTVYSMEDLAKGVMVEKVSERFNAAEIYEKLLNFKGRLK